MYAKVYGSTINGLDGHIVTVEVDISQGLPLFDIVGLPNQSVREARERVRAAIKNSHFEFPMRRIIVNLAPADLKKESSGLDVAIAMGIIIASGQLRLRKSKRDLLVSHSVFIGELSLDGAIKPMRGMLAMAEAVSISRFKSIFTGLKNGSQAISIEGLHIYGSTTLEDYRRLRRCTWSIYGKASYGNKCSWFTPYCYGWSSWIREDYVGQSIAFYNAAPTGRGALGSKQNT